MKKIAILTVIIGIMLCACGAKGETSVSTNDEIKKVQEKL